MSVSTDAYLFYGLCLSADDDLIPDWLQGDGDLWDIIEQYSEKMQEFGCVLSMHCSGDAPMLFLAVERSFYSAYRGYPKKVEFEIGTTGDWNYWGWIERINRAADYLGWPKERRDIGWWLASWWD